MRSDETRRRSRDRNWKEFYRLLYPQFPEDSTTQHTKTLGGGPRSVIRQRERGELPMDKHLYWFLQEEKGAR
jgi:hypothetical protein